MVVHVPQSQALTVALNEVHSASSGTVYAKKGDVYFVSSKAAATAQLKERLATSRTKEQALNKHVHVSFPKSL